MIIVTRADIPDALAKAWLQHLRNFDTANPGCHFQVCAETDLSTLEVVDALRSIDPPLPTLKVIKRET